MIFEERQTDDGYTYDAHNVIGKLHIQSDTRINGGLLDDMVGLLLQSNLRAQTVKGSIQHKTGKVTYTLTREPMWTDDNEHDTDESWNDTPTSTKQPDSASTPSATSRTASNWSAASRWLSRFVAAFRTAWRNSV